MKTMFDPKNLLATAILLVTVTPAFADGMQMTGDLPPKPPTEQSWTDQVKSGFNKFTKAILPEKEEPQKIDELSLSRKAKSSPELHVALAQSCEQKGQTQNAIAEYEKALKLDPNHEETLLQYARFCDRINQSPKAELLFLKATEIYPREARVFNHQGLFFVRHKRYSEAAQAFSKAVALEPIKDSYRGNLAVVLVDLGRYSEAYKQLRAVQSPDTAYYNLGYLLQERGKTELAMKHFQVALKKNPDHKEARIWLTHLQQQPQEPAEMVATQPSQPQPQEMNVMEQNQAFSQAMVTDRQPVPPALEPRIATKPLPSVTRAPFSPAENPSVQRQPMQQQPVQPSLQPLPELQVPNDMPAPMRTHSYYRTTIPPAQQQPYVVPDPGVAGQNVPQQSVTPTQPESPSLVAPSDGTAPVRRLPSNSARRTVNASSDRYITPLPPIDWSDKFKVGQ